MCQILIFARRHSTVPIWDLQPLPIHMPYPGKSPHRPQPHVEPKFPLYTYYCICGEFVLVCNTLLEQLAQRPMDHSRVLRCLDSSPGEGGQRIPAHIYKISASQGPIQVIQRYVGCTNSSDDNSFERQYMFLCTRCQLPIGYEHTAPPLKSGGKFTFILPGALSYVPCMSLTQVDSRVWHPPTCFSARRSRRRDSMAWSSTWRQPGPLYCIARVLDASLYTYLLVIFSLCQLDVHSSLRTQSSNTLSCASFSVE